MLLEMINYLIISLLSLSVGVSQQNWNMELMKEHGGLIYSPNSNKPYTGDIYSIYVNGKKKLEGKYNNGIKDGLWIEWYKNGQKMEEEIYKNGEEDGKWTWWYKNGQKKEEGIFKGGKKDGLFTRWYEN